jgi:ATP-binding cassette, subfamily B, bacterial
VAVAVAYLFRHRIRPMTRRQMEAHSAIYTTLDESLSGIEDVKIYRGEEIFRERLERQGTRLRDVSLDLARDQAKLFPMIDLSISIVLLGALVFGGQMVLAGTLTVGTLVVFYYYIARALGPIRSASGLVFSWYSINAAVERIAELLESNERIAEPLNPRTLGPGPMDIDFVDVTFHYEDLETGSRFLALDAVNLSIPAGSRVALLGPSGSGKSTTGKLLARLFDPEQGVITMGGVPLTQLALDDVRGRVGYVGQEVFLFHGTIAENIRFGAPHDVTEQQIEEVVEIAQVAPIIADKELGLETPVGEKGLRLSGGQKKRIALARALLRQPGLLIIDQLASDLEEDLNRSIFEGIRKRRNLSIVYLGHRIPAGFEPDAVYWMEHGRLDARTGAQAIA